MKLEAGILINIKNEDTVFSNNTILLANDSLSVKKNSDFVTRSIIDPFIIAKQENNTQNESYINFYNNHWQNVIKQEAQRENYAAVKVITHQTRTISNNRKYYFEGNADWILGVGIVLVALLVWIKIYYGKALMQTFRSTVNQQSARRLISEKSSFLQNASAILTAIYLLGSGLFLYECINYYHIKLLNFKSIYQFLFCLTGVLFFYFLKSFLYLISGFILKSEREIMEFLCNNNIYYRATGILILPIIISIPYVSYNIAEILLYCGIAIFCCSFFMRVIRGFVVSFKMKLSLFYSFLYFCVLEILPMLYVFKIMKLVI